MDGCVTTQPILFRNFLAGLVTRFSIPRHNTFTHYIKEDGAIIIELTVWNTRRTELTHFKF